LATGVRPIRTPRGLDATCLTPLTVAHRVPHPTPLVCLLLAPAHHAPPPVPLAPHSSLLSPARRAPTCTSLLALAVRRAAHSLPQHAPPPRRAKVGAAGGGGARVSPLATGSHPDDQNRPARSFLPYVANMYFKCFRRFTGMLQLLHMDVAHFGSVSETCCKCLFKMFHQF
jgi:hypothetical protein